jgi:RNA-dependent RNA polymerase
MIQGMTAQRPDTTPHDAPKVWLRPSQRKIKYSPNETRDPAHLIMDILRTSYMRTPARVSPESIINLTENGVPQQVFIDLMKTSVTTIVTGLTTWDGPEAMYDLWLNVERAGAVCFARRAREAAGEARVRGFGDRQTEEDEDEDEDEDEERLEGFDKALDQRSSAWWADQISGCPSSLEETVMVLLDSGFTPQECPILREKLKQVVTTKVKTRTQNYRYDIELSVGAFVIPGLSIPQHYTP